MPATLSREEIDRFHEEGFLSVPRITSEEEVVRIRAVYDRLFDQRTGWDKGDFFDFAGSDEPGRAPTVPQLLNPSRYEESLRQTQFRSNAHAIARQLLGPTAELVFEHAMLKPPMTGGETPWHQDEAFYPKFTDYHSVTFWMPLQAVDVVNGCLDFIPGSNNGPLLPHRSINNDPRIHGLEAIGAEGDKRVTCPLQVGGATIHHYRTLHHAGPNLSNAPRRAYALGFGVRSRQYTQRTDWPWNVEKATARGQRAYQAQTPMQRYVRKLKDAAKSVLK